MTDSEIRIYVACLASYNNGRLYGAWVDADQDADTIADEVAFMLAGSPYPNVLVNCPNCPDEPEAPRPDCATCKGGGKIDSAEEWAIHDYEGFGEIKLSEHESFADVAMLAKLIGEHGVELVSAAYDRCNEVENLEEWIQEHYSGTYRTREEWAEEWLNDCGDLAKVPESLRSYFDFDKWARDCELSGDIDFVAGGEGVLVFHS